MEINLETEKTIDAFSTPPIEWKSKNLTFYRTYNQKSMILRLPDGCYIEVDWGAKYFVSEANYNIIMNLTDNFTTLNKKKYAEAEDIASSCTKEGACREVVIPISTGPIYNNNLFHQWDTIISRIPNCMVLPFIKDKIHSNLFDGDVPDVFTGKSGIWSQLSRYRHDIYKNNKLVYPIPTGLINNNGIIIL